MIARYDISTVKLNQQAQVEQGSSIGLADTDADIFGARIVDDAGRPVSLAGTTVRGFFIRPDGATVEIIGNTDGSTASVTLPAECYTLPGTFTLAIKVEQGGVIRTARIVAGKVVVTRTQTDVVSDDVFADFEALNRKISTAIIAPPGGVNGQFLSKTANGYAWADGGGIPSALSIEGVTYETRIGTSGEARKLTFVLEV